MFRNDGSSLRGAKPNRNAVSLARSDVLEYCIMSSYLLSASLPRLHAASIGFIIRDTASASIGVLPVQRGSRANNRGSRIPNALVSASLLFRCAQQVRRLFPSLSCSLRSHRRRRLTMHSTEISLIRAAKAEGMYV